MVAGRKAVATAKSSAESGVRLLQKHSANEEYRQYDLKDGNNVDGSHDG